MGSGGGSDQHFCLRWNNFHSNIATSFEQLRDHEDFVDVTLACEGRTIKAHKVVLSACSPYFRNLLKQNPCQHPIIILRDVAFVDVSALLSFVYQGEVYVSQDRLTAFLHTAELLHIKGLTDQHHHHTTASTTHTVPISSSNNNNGSLGSSIAVSLLGPQSGGASVPLTHLIAAAPQQPPQAPIQGCHPAARGVPRSPSPTRPHSSPSPPAPVPPYIPPPPTQQQHISPPPKKRRHHQQAVATITSPLSSSSSCSTDPAQASSPLPHLSEGTIRCSTSPPLATPKLECGAPPILLGGSTLAAALTAPRGEPSGPPVPPPPLMEVKQEMSSSPIPLMMEDSNSSCGGAVEHQAVNLVVEGSSSSSPTCSILRQRIQGYQGSPDAPPPPNYPPPRVGVDEDESVEANKDGLTPPTAVAIIRRQQHMLGLAAAAAAAGVYSSNSPSGGTPTSLTPQAELQAAPPHQGVLQPPITTTITPTSSPIKAFSQSGGGVTTPNTTPGGIKVGGGRPRYAGPRNCPHCGKRYSTIAALKYHVGLVHGVSDKVPCFYCHHWFDIRTDLKKHLEVAHNEHS